MLQSALQRHTLPITLVSSIFKHFQMRVAVIDTVKLYQPVERAVVYKEEFT